MLQSVGLTLTTVLWSIYQHGECLVACREHSKVNDPCISEGITVHTRDHHLATDWKVPSSIPEGGKIFLAAKVQNILEVHSVFCQIKQRSVLSTTTAHSSVRSRKHGALRLPLRRSTQSPAPSHASPLCSLSSRLILFYSFCSPIVLVCISTSSLLFFHS